MGDLIAIAAITASVAAVGTSLAAAGQAGASGKTQRALAEQQAQLQAQQTVEQVGAITDQKAQVASAARQDNQTRLIALRRTLGAQEALRGARGLAGDSVGASVLTTASMDEAARDLDTIAINAERDRSSLGLSASRALLQGEVQLQQTRSSSYAASAASKSAEVAAYGQAIQSGAGAARQGYNFLSTPAAAADTRGPKPLK